MNIEKQLSKEINDLEKKVKFRRLYNVRNHIIQSVLNSGIAIDYALPYILSAIIISNTFVSMRENKPFHIDSIQKQESIELIDTSTGLHQENRSFDIDYSNEIIEYSTGWKHNKNDLFERDIVTFELNRNIDINNLDEIFSLTKEDLEKRLSIKNIQTIQKAFLTPEDEIYMEDAIIVINHKKSSNTKSVKETEYENTIHTIYYLFLVSTLGFSIHKVKKMIFKDTIKNNINSQKPKFKIISTKEVETLKKILEVKRQNLSLIQDEETTPKRKQLRKEKRRTT